MNHNFISFFLPNCSTVLQRTRMSKIIEYLLILVIFSVAHFQFSTGEPLTLEDLSIKGILGSLIECQKKCANWNWCRLKTVGGLIGSCESAPTGCNCNCFPWETCS